MAGVVGLDVAGVRQLGHGLRQQADTLSHLMGSIQALVDELRQHWHGHDAEEFRGWWETQHRAALDHAIAALAGLGQSALNNADEQEHASGGTAAGSLARPVGTGINAGLDLQVASAVLGAGGVLAKAADPAWTTGRYTKAWDALTHGLGPAFRYKQSPALQWLAHSPLKHLANNPALSRLGTVGGVIGAGVTVGQATQAIAGHHYTEAAGYGIDAASEGLKSSGNPVAYGAGVDLAIWKDVGAAAQAVDWSHLGDIRHATISDWGNAFGESLKETAGKAWQWF